MTEYKEVRTTQHEPGSEARVTTFKVTQLIWLFLGFLEGVLGLRFIFKLIGVNPANAFATLLYKVTDFFVAPFANLTGAPAAGGMVFEFSTLLAMIVYGLVGWALVRLVYVLFYRPRGPVSTRQTVVAEHTPQQGVSQTRTTTTQATSVDNQTTDTERNNI
jgi:hypothetical protein